MRKTRTMLLSLLVMTAAMLLAACNSEAVPAAKEAAPTAVSTESEETKRGLTINEPNITGVDAD